MAANYRPLSPSTCTQTRRPSRGLHVSGPSQGPGYGAAGRRRGEATHVFFYAYVAKEEEDELIEVNQRLFKTVSSRSSPPPTVKCLHEMAEMQA